MMKKSWVDSESIPMRESDIPSMTAPSIESVIALSAPIMLPPIEVPLVRVEMATDENDAPEPSAVSLAGVQAKSVAPTKLEPSAIRQTIPQVPPTMPMRSRA